MTLRLKVLAVCRDGGTLKCIDENTNTQWFVDNRMGSKTMGVLYDKYPGEDDATAYPEIKYKIVNT